MNRRGVLMRRSHIAVKWSECDNLLWSNPLCKFYMMLWLQGGAQEVYRCSSITWWQKSSPPTSRTQQCSTSPPTSGTQCIYHCSTSPCILLSRGVRKEKTQCSCCVAAPNDAEHLEKFVSFVNVIFFLTVIVSSFVESQAI